MARSKTGQASRKQAEREQRKLDAAKKKRIRFGVVIGAAAIAVVAFVALTWPEPDVGSTQAETWDLPALAGEGRYALDDFSGKPTVAVFFASWCTVCEHEIPEFLALSEQISEDVNFVGINSQDNGRGMGDADKWGISGTWPLARDIGGRNGSGLSVDTFGARGMPLTVIYTPEGGVAHIQRGGISGAQLQTLLNDLFAT